MVLPIQLRLTSNNGEVYK